MSFNVSSSAATDSGGLLSSGDRRQHRGSYEPASATTGVRVVSSSTNPADEVRMTIAALNARAQQLVAEGVDHRVVCSGRSLYEASRQAVESARQQALRSTAGDAYTPTSQASVELFMAKHLGFDVQGQQRLLQQLQLSQRQMLADMANTESAGAASTAAAGSVGGGGVMGRLGGGSDSVDAVVARLKGEMIAQAQHEVHQRQKELLQRQEYAVFKAAWSPFYVSMADDYEMLAMRQANPTKADLKSNSVAVAALRAQHGSAAGGSLGPTSGLISLLNSGSPVADELNRKIAAFAPIVTHYPPAQWIAHFSAYVRDRVRVSGDELAALWVSAERILAAIDTQGSAANTMSYVAASRLVMEEKALGRLLTTTMRLDPSRVEEVANMPASRVMDVITRACGTTNAWVHIFEAMRVGRYDAAVEAAKRTGHSAVEAALRVYAEASPTDRVLLPPALELRELYAEVRRGSVVLNRGSGVSASGHASSGSAPVASNTPTHANAGEPDAHRQAVLFLLLAGATGESAEVNKRVLVDLCSCVGNSIEDVLWMRLFCVRGVEETPKGGPVQSLSYVQKLILDDLQDLVTMAHGNIQRIASFLVHALLPSSGLRLLLENDVTCVDGLHLVLCFNAANILQCSALESPVDVAKHIARYCSVVLLDIDRRSLDGVLAGAATFDYFHKMGFDEAFSEFCLKDVVATRLFGQRGILAVSPSWNPLAASGETASTTQRQQLDGLLLAGSGPLSPDLMQAISNTAELAASRNNAPLALHLLLSLARACLRASSAPSAGYGETTSSSGRGTVGPATVDVNAYATSLAALQRAVKLACPALAQAFYLPPHTSRAAALFNVCAQLRVAVREAGGDALCSLSGASTSGGVVLVELDPASGVPQLSRLDLAAFDTLCTMADVFLAAHAANLEQALRSFFALPFVPDAQKANDVERCVVAFGGATTTASATTSSVVVAAGAIVPLAFRVAASLLQVYAQQQQQQQHRRGTAAGETATAKGVSLRQSMLLVCEWLRRCGSPSGGGSSGAGGMGSGGAGVSLYEACLNAIADFEENYLH